MSKLLRGLVVLSMAPMFAAYGDGGSEGALSGVSVGGEFYATGTFLAFSTDNALSTASADATEALSAGNVLGVSALNYADGQDKLMNYGFGAALTASMEMGGGLDVMGRIAIHSALKDAVGLTKTVSAKNTFAGTSKSKMAFTPSILVGMDGLHLGVGYRMTEYEFAENKFAGSAGTTVTEKTSKSNTVVFQIRGSAEVEAGDMSYSVFAFGETNLGAESDSDVEDYMKLYASNNGAFEAAVTEPSKVHEAYNAFGIGIGANFYDA